MTKLSKFQEKNKNIQKTVDFFRKKKHAKMFFHVLSARFWHMLIQLKNLFFSGIFFLLNECT